MKYRVLVDKKLIREEDVRISQASLRPYFELYHFLGTDFREGEFYHYVFSSDRVPASINIRMHQ